METKTLEAIGCETMRQGRGMCDRDKDITAVSWLLEIPLPLLYDILIRIPADTVFSCRCVCKTFFNILTDPQFAQDHFTRASTANEEEALVITNNDNIRDTIIIYNYLSELEKTDHANSHCQTLSMPASAPKIALTASLVGSCNGFLCISYFGFDPLHIYYYICNPILGEFLALPPIDSIKFLNPAFGFCPKTKQYKVILSFRSSPCKIHTLGTDCWREISNDIPMADFCGSYDQSFRGFVHWIVDQFTVPEMICSFNLETEQAAILPTPSHLTHDTLPGLSYVQIGSLGGSFCLSYRHGTTLEICVMKNYGVKESWRKVFSIDLRLKPGFRNSTLSSGYAFINGNLFCKHEQSSLICYNLQKGTIINMLANDVQYARVRHFRPSFTSLKDIAVDSGGNVEVVGRKMQRNNWCDKGFQFIR